jgi:hypothetical protein
MPNIFDTVLRKLELLRRAEQTVPNLKEEELLADGISESIYRRFRISSPYLEKDKTTPRVGKEMIDPYNVPADMHSFTPGTEIEFAEFTVPIQGDHALAEQIVQDRLGRHLYIQGGSLRCKFHSRESITNNPTVEAAMRQKAIVTINMIQTRLDQFKDFADQFNEQELRPAIIKVVEDERRKRKDKKDTESRLKTF